MKSLVSLVLIGLLGINTQASTVLNVRYDAHAHIPIARVLTEYCYNGDEPSIDLRLESCLETFPQQCSVHVVVADEMPRELAEYCVQKTLIYDLTPLIPAHITFEGSDGSFKKIFAN